MAAESTRLELRRGAADGFIVQEEEDTSFESLCQPAAAWVGARGVRKRDTWKAGMQRRRLTGIGIAYLDAVVQGGHGIGRWQGGGEEFAFRACNSTRTSRHFWRAGRQAPGNAKCKPAASGGTADTPSSMFVAGRDTSNACGGFLLVYHTSVSFQAKQYLIHFVFPRPMHVSKFRSIRDGRRVRAWCKLN